MDWESLLEQGDVVLEKDQQYNEFEEKEAQDLISQEEQKKQETQPKNEQKAAKKDQQVNNKSQEKSNQNKTNSDNTFNNMPVTNKIPNYQDKFNKQMMQEQADMDAAQDLFGEGFIKSSSEIQTKRGLEVGEKIIVELKEFQSYGKSFAIVMKNEQSKLNVVLLIVEFLTKIKEQLTVFDIQKILDKSKELYNLVQQEEKAKDSKKKIQAQYDTVVDLFSDLDLDEKRYAIVGDRILNNMDDFGNFGRVLADKFSIVKENDHITAFVTTLLQNLKDKFKDSDYQKIIDKTQLFVNELSKDDKGKKGGKQTDFQSQQKKAFLEQKKMAAQKHAAQQAKVKQDLINAKKTKVDQLYIDDDNDSDQQEDDEDNLDPLAQKVLKEQNQLKAKQTKKQQYKETEEQQ